MRICPADPLLKARQPQRAPEKLVLPVEMAATRREPRLLAGEHARVSPLHVGGGGASVRLERGGGAETKPLNCTSTADAAPAETGGRQSPRAAVSGWTRSAAGFFRRQSSTGSAARRPACSCLGNRRATWWWICRRRSSARTGLLYLAHTHIPTIWDEQNVIIENIDWTRARRTAACASSACCRTRSPSVLRSNRKVGSVEMELWLRNGSDQTLTGLRTQICGHLKGAPDFNEQTTTNKIFRVPSRGGPLGGWRPLDSHRLGTLRARLGSTAGAVHSRRPRASGLPTRRDRSRARPAVVLRRKGC